MTGSGDDWIVIPNWAKFQHYGARRLLWIKLYVELMGNDKWLHLALSERGLLVCLWLSYGTHRGQIRVSDVSSLCLQKVPRRHLDSLQAAGFIELSASKPPKLARTELLANDVESASTDKEEEKEVEEEPPYPHKDVGDNFFVEEQTNPRAKGTNPRAVAKNDRDQVHQQLLEHARQIADGWDDSGGSDVFDERLDQLELEHHDRLRALERDDLWQKAFHQ